VRTSAATGEGIEELKRALFELCPAPVEQEAPSDDGMVDFLDYRPQPQGRGAYRIFRTERGFRVEGSPPEREALREVLRAVGAKPGAEVEIGDETVTL
jgi:hypothetical protein